MKLTRRGLFGVFAGAVAAPAVAKFLPAPSPAISVIDFERMYIRPAMLTLADSIDMQVAMFCRRNPMKIGDTIQVRRPQRFTA